MNITMIYGDEVDMLYDKVLMWCIVVFASIIICGVCVGSLQEHELLSLGRC